MLINAPRGTKDMLPEVSYKWHFVEDKFKCLCKQYGFKEIRTPIFEHTELFQRGVGDSTDIVRKEMYTFEDHGHRSITLKPEGTSPVVRAFIENKLYALPQPSKYFYITPCFRYEKPQSGRLREFHQFGVEIFGTPKMTADAEVICLADDFLKELGIKDIGLRINSVGCPTCRASYREALRAFLKPHYDGLCADCRERYERNPMRTLDCKVPSCNEITKNAPHMTDYLCEECSLAFRELQEDLDAFGIEYEIDTNIVRGLDYYTRTAFEFVTTQIGAQGTVCGGGRYDDLIEQIGGPATPGVGFGLGIERLLLLMESAGVEIPKEGGPKALIAVMGGGAKRKGLSLMRDFRKRGLSVQMDNLERNFKGQMKYADRLGTQYVILIGDNELASGVASVKNMAKSEQREVPFEELYDMLCEEEK